jgi:hypothetical protein
MFKLLLKSAMLGVFVGFGLACVRLGCMEPEKREEALRNVGARYDHARAFVDRLILGEARPAESAGSNLATTKDR